ncbi:hypothetical protein IG631_19750 [Alternaria alternata]|nr:hypothetical protein IG631_19750 [Alternaria alternata]
MRQVRGDPRQGQTRDYVLRTFSELPDRSVSLHQPNCGQELPRGVSKRVSCKHLLQPITNQASCAPPCGRNMGSTCSHARLTPSPSLGQENHCDVSQALRSFAIPKARQARPRCGVTGCQPAPRSTCSMDHGVPYCISHVVFLLCILNSKLRGHHA